MTQRIKNVLVIVLISTIVSSGIMYLNQQTAVGAITNIAGTDKLSDSRTTINDNFTDLDITKMEMSTTSVDGIITLSGLTTANALTSASALVTIGTITTGTWQGTGIDVARQGTGTTSPSVYLTILGNGANGFTVASTTGTNGQFWTSGGEGDYPTWTTGSIDTSLNFTWTGNHDFIASTTMATSSTRIGESYGGLAPAGSILAWAATSTPSGWLLTDGTSYKTVKYPDLFNVIKYNYGGSGDDFNVPDIQNRNIIMASTTDNIAQTGGEQRHVPIAAEMFAHSHTVGGVNSGSAGAGLPFQGSDQAEGFTGNTSSTGGGEPFNVLDPYIVLNYIIKY